jgi:hypothetical protein
MEFSVPLTARTDPTRTLSNRSNERRLPRRRRALPSEMELRDQLHEAWVCGAYDLAEVGVLDLSVY